MSLKRDLKKKQDEYLQSKAHLWHMKKPEEVARQERISVSLARELMKKLGVTVDSDRSRLLRKRKVLCQGKTPKQVKEELEPEMSLDNIRAYARNNEIELVPCKRGRPKT